MEDEAHVLKCIILTLKKENVLIPGSLVSEITSVENIEDIAGSPDWLIGQFQWRGQDIPLLSFEVSGGNEIGPRSRSTQVAVLNGLNDDPSLATPFLGLMISGVPHVSRFTADQIKPNEDVSAEHPMVAQRVKVNGVSMSILDIDAMAAMVAEAR